MRPQSLSRQNRSDESQRLTRCPHRYEEADQEQQMIAAGQYRRECPPDELPHDLADRRIECDARRRSGEGQELRLPRGGLIGQIRSGRLERRARKRIEPRGQTVRWPTEAVRDFHVDRLSVGTGACRHARDVQRRLAQPEVEVTCDVSRDGLERSVAACRIHTTVVTSQTGVGQERQRYLKPDVEAAGLGRNHHPHNLLDDDVVGLRTCADHHACDRGDYAWASCGCDH